MQKISVSIFLLLIAFVGFSQDSNMLRGKVATSDATKVTINIINLNKKLGTINDKNGFFNINADSGDIIIFSSIRYKQTTHVVTEQNLKEASLEIILELEVNELDEVKVSKNNLTGNIEQDAKKINTYKNHLPLFSAKDLDSTRFVNEKGIPTIKNIAITDEMEATPVNIIAVGSMIYSILKKKEKNKKVQVKTLEISNYYSNLFLTKELCIPGTEIYNFLDFLNENEGTKYILESKNDLKILEFLISQRDIYFSKNNIKK